MRLNTATIAAYTFFLSNASKVGQMIHVVKYLFHVQRGDPQFLSPLDKLLDNSAHDTQCILASSARPEPELPVR